jgi:uncharacterized membrane protein YphA (DoxX/SURF4 family)
MGEGRRTISPYFVFAVRACVALVWLYEGLWLKLIRRAPHELAVVEGVGGFGPLTPLQFLQAVGAGETLLAVGVLSGLWWRGLAWFQIALLAAMNAVGILMGGGAIAEPAGLVVRNLPFVACIALVGLCGPGAFALAWGGRGAKT